MWIDSKTARVCGAALFASTIASADSVSVPAVELREQEGGRYVVEALVAPAIASGIDSPLPPARCGVGELEREDDVRGVRMRYRLDCGDRPLVPRDMIVLPWAVDGIQLTAFWLDGTTRRALFGRDQSSVVVRLTLIMDRDESFVGLMREHGTAGWKHFWNGGSHLILVLALSLLLRRAWVGLAGLAAGHAIALVLADAGLVGLPRAPADAALAGAAALLVAGLVKRPADTRGLLGMTLILGVLHGLGNATALADRGAPASELIPSLFIINVCLDVTAFIVAAVSLLGWSVFGSGREKMAAPIGIAAMFLLLAVMRDGLTPGASASDAAAGFLELDAPAPAANDAAPPSQLAADGRLASPFMSYLIVEPYQVRHEVLVDVNAVAEWVDVPVDAASRIPVAAQERLADDVLALVSQNARLSVDGHRAEVASGRAALVLLGPTGAVARETPIPEPARSAVLGVTLVFETAGIANSVELDWGLFSSAVTSVRLVATDPRTIAEVELTPDAPRFSWRNTLGDFELPVIEAMAAAKPRLPLASLALGILALAAQLVWRKRSVALVCCLGAYVLYPFARVEASIPLVSMSEARIDRAQAVDVIERLLTNVYRSFDIENEALIYDRLALTVTGDQLVEVYLESRRALELEERGGARVRIDEVVVKELGAIRDTGVGEYEIDVRWTAGGSVNHFGHIHFRQNEYDATLTLAPVEGTWKIRSVERMEERRVL